MSYSLEKEGIPVRDFLLGLKWVNPFVVQTFEVGRWEDTLLRRFKPLLEAYTI